MTHDPSSLVQVGHTIDGKYRVERILGAGAMGIVVAATHVHLHELRAIKLMLPGTLGQAGGVARFMKEARAASRLKSQHAVKVHDVGTHEGCPFIVMEHLEGTDLQGVIEQSGSLPVPEAVMYLLQACEAIGEAHAAGIIHRDLKPANMFLATGVGGRPCVKVLDFGIAKVPDVADAAYAAHMTSTGTVMGTPLYMSPEQMTSTRSADPRSDIWSLGVILYNFVTGWHPFEAETIQLLCAAVLRDPPVIPSTRRPDIPREVEAIILRCLQKNPAQRYQSVAELVDALTPFTAPTPRASFPQSAIGAETQVATQVFPSPPPRTETLTQRVGAPLKLARAEAASGSIETPPLQRTPADDGQRRRRSLQSILAAAIAVSIVVLVLVYRRSNADPTLTPSLPLDSTVTPVQPSPTSSPNELAPPSLPPAVTPNPTHEALNPASPSPIAHPPAPTASNPSHAPTSSPSAPPTAKVVETQTLPAPPLQPTPAQPTPTPTASATTSSKASGRW